MLTIGTVEFLRQPYKILVWKEKNLSVQLDFQMIRVHEHA